ncbi:hypothetical protein NQ272_27670, partial [Escherichia coli]|nr:hypothetical protein [Escherichia coli]
SRSGIELIKINYGQNGLYPMIDFNFTDQNKFIFFESLDIENLKLIKGDAKQYPKYINRHRGYNITHFELKGNYLLKNDKYTIQ